MQLGLLENNVVDESFNLLDPAHNKVVVLLFERVDHQLLVADDLLETSLHLFSLDLDLLFEILIAVVVEPLHVLEDGVSSP